MFLLGVESSIAQGINFTSLLLHIYLTTFKTSHASHIFHRNKHQLFMGLTNEAYFYVLPNICYVGYNGTILVSIVDRKHEPKVRMK